MDWRMAQEFKYLLYKHKALSLNPSPISIPTPKRIQEPSPIYTILFKNIFPNHSGIELLINHLKIMGVFPVTWK
jgi:hypothetical protein